MYSVLRINNCFYMDITMNPDSDEKIIQAFCELLGNATYKLRTAFMSIPVRDAVDADCIVRRALYEYLAIRGYKDTFLFCAECKGLVDLTRIEGSRVFCSDQCMQNKIRHPHTRKIAWGDENT